MIGPTNGALSGAKADQHLFVTNSSSGPVNDTIYINTSNNITKYTISYFKPAFPQEGEVWLPMGTTSSNDLINAMTKDQILLNMYTSYQYIGGEWVRRPIQTYSDSTWHTPTILYDHGAYVNPASTLANEQANNSSTQWKKTFSGNDNYFVAVVEHKTDCIQLNAGVTNSEVDIYGRLATITCQTAIDLTNYSKLIVTGNVYYSNLEIGSGDNYNLVGNLKVGTNSSVKTYAAGWNDVGTNHQTSMLQIRAMPNARTELVSNISGVTGTQYIGISAYKNYGARGNLYFDIETIRLE